MYVTIEMKKTTTKYKVNEENKFGDDSKEDTPVPIPNTVVKLFSADGSWGFPPVRVGRCQANENT